MLGDKIATGNATDGLIKVLYYSSQQQYNATFASTHSPEHAIVHEIPFRVFIVGDLKSHAAWQGWEYSTTHWCFCCDLQKTEWQKKEHVRGLTLTVEQITNLANNVPPGKTNKGIKTEPLIRLLGINR